MSRSCFEREAMDTADAYSEFILTTLAAIAQEESRFDFSKHCMEQSETVSAGNVCNKDIYGYEIPQRGVYSERERIPIPGSVHHPGRSRDCSDGVPVFTKEELSFTQIAQKLDALHIPPPNSGCRQRQKRKPTVLPAGALKEEDKAGVGRQRMFGT